MKAGDAREGAATAALAAESREYWRVARGAAARLARATALEMDCMFERMWREPTRRSGSSQDSFFSALAQITPSRSFDSLELSLASRSEGGSSNTIKT